MRIYHGGTEIIELPDVSKGRPGLDFGQGFYVTDNFLKFIENYQL